MKPRTEMALSLLATWFVSLSAIAYFGAAMCAENHKCNAWLASLAAPQETK